MTLSKSMPSPAPQSAAEDQSRLIDKDELIERMATEMRVGSGGELPHSFCVEQVRRQLAGKQAEASAANDTTAQPTRKAQGGGSVFHAWALPE